MTPQTPPTVWMVIDLALEALRHGVQIVGSPGSGKSLILKAFRMSLIRLMQMRPRFDLHIVDFDSKRDLYGIQRAFPPFCPVFDVNPFVWADIYDLLGDIDDPRDIWELVAQLIDISTNSSQPFFPQAARLIQDGVTTRHWEYAWSVADFRDLVLSSTDPERTRMVLGSHPLTKGLLAMVTDNEVGLSVLATLMNEMARFRTIAALQGSNTKGRKVSVRSVLKNRFSYFSLPYDDKSVETLAAFTRLILVRLQQTLLAENLAHRYAVVLLDELALIPKGVDLSLGSIKGREAGWCPVFAYQSPTMARVAFSKDRFDAAVSTLKTFVVMNLPDEADAAWAAKRLASHQGFLRIDSSSIATPRGGGGQGSTVTHGWAENFTTLENVTPGEIQALPVPTPGNPVIEGIMATIPFKPFKFRIDIPTLVAQFFPKGPPVAPPSPRDPKDMVLRVWDSSDLKRLRLSR
ncbi:MAG: type IV secretion system DNA-binding domain-containing protein [Gemmataceae bacterium]